MTKDFGSTWKRNLLKSIYYDDTTIVSSSSITDMEIINNNIYIGTEHGLFISTDYGTSWFRAPIYDVRDPDSLMQIWGGQRLIENNNRIFVSFYSEGIYFTSDTGKTWNCATANLRDYVDSVTKHKYYIQNPITYSINDSIIAIAIVRSSKSSFAHSLVYSTDLGNSWQFSKYEFSYNDNKYADTAIYEMLGCGKNIYIGTDKGLFYSTDLGTKWLPLINGSDTSFIYNYNVGYLKKNDNYLFFSTGISGSGNGGSYRLKLKDCEPILTGINEPEIEFINQSVYPNPASDYIILPHDETGSLPEKAEIYNMLGEKVFEQDFQYGSESKIDVSGFPTGVYYLVYLNNSNIKSQRFIISR
jgi:hypothetical protein